MEYKYKVMRPKRTSMKEKLMRGVLALLLVGGALLYFANPLHAQELDLTLQSANLEVEIPWNYEQIKADGLLLQQYEESQKIDFKISNDPIIRDWILWNAADVYTTHRAISGGYAKELNPLLSDFPSLERLIVHKLLVNYILYQANFFEEREVINVGNTLGWLAIANNTWIIIDNE